MEERISIIPITVFRSKDGSRCGLEFAIADLKESQNRKGYTMMTSWFDNDSIFNQIKSSDIGKLFEADVCFEPTSNGQVRMRIKNVYN